MERQVPSRVPRILPLVRDGDDISVVEMFPFVIAALASLSRRRRRLRITVQPLLNDIVIVLLGPKQSAQRLPHYCASIVGKIGRDYGLVKFICFVNAIGKGLLEILIEGGGQ